MSLLAIDVSHQGIDASKSRQLGKVFLDKFKEKHPEVEIHTLDLAKQNIPHLDTDAIVASFIPEEGRSEAQKEKLAARMALINQIKEVKYILVTSPMYNWNVPSAFKAYIDNIIMPGVLDAGTKSLAGKVVTILLATGGAYGPGSWVSPKNLLCSSWLTRYHLAP